MSNVKSLTILSNEMFSPSIKTNSLPELKISGPNYYRSSCVLKRYTGYLQTLFGWASVKFKTGLKTPGCCIGDLTVCQRNIANNLTRFNQSQLNQWAFQPWTDVDFKHHLVKHGVYHRIRQDIAHTSTLNLG